MMANPIENEKEPKPGEWADRKFVPVMIVGSPFRPSAWYVYRFTDQVDL